MATEIRGVHFCSNWLLTKKLVSAHAARLIIGPFTACRAAAGRRLPQIAMVVFMPGLLSKQLLEFGLIKLNSRHLFVHAGSVVAGT